MRLLTLLGGCLLLAALVACGGDADEARPTAMPTEAEATATNEATATEPSGTATPSGSPTPTEDVPPTAMPAAQITAENFIELEVVSDGRVPGAQYLAWQPDGNLVVASNELAMAFSPSGEGGGLVFEATSPEGVEIVGVSEAGLLATTSDRQVLEIVDLQGSSEPVEIDTGGQFGSVDISPDGTRLAVGQRDEIAVDLWILETGAVEQQFSGFETGAPVYSARFGPQGESIVWQSRGTVQVTNIATAEPHPEMRHELPLSGLVWSQTSAVLITTWGDFATLWEPETGTRLEDLDQAATALQPAVLSDPDLLAVATSDGVKLWDLASLTEIATLEVEALQIAVSPDGNYLATVAQDGSVAIWAASP